MSIRYNRQEKQKRRGSEREPPAHKSNRLWLLDFSPDQVHGLPLQGASFKVASFDSTLCLIVSKERILSMGKSLKKNHFHFFRAQPRSRHIIIGIVSVADASLRRMYTFEWNCSRSGREYCQKGAASMSIGANGRAVAVITGASSGFGMIFADRLAAEGCDLMIVARREEKLNSVAEKIRSKYGVEVEAVVADLANQDDLAEIERRVERFSTLRYLINNAGFGGNQQFPDVSVEVETRMVLTHCLASMRLARAALVPMKAQGKKKDAGYIVNVASVAGFLAGQGAADYCGTKAYLVTFSKCLQCDVRRFGIRVQALCPGFANTEFHISETMKRSNVKQIYPEIIWQSADRVVDASLRSLRRRFRPNVVCIPTVFYKLVGYFGSSWLFSPLRLALSGGRVR